jgi:hypothetical protein
MTQGPDGENYHGYSVDDEDQPGAESTLDDDLDDPMDRGYSPPEKWSAAQGHGNTPLEEELGESLDQRLAQEEPEVAPQAREEAVDEADEDREVGDERSGRLVQPDQGLAEDVEPAEVAEDVGIDGAAASAEEAAMHTVDSDAPDSLHDEDDLAR